MNASSIPEELHLPAPLSGKEKVRIELALRLLENKVRVLESRRRHCWRKIFIDLTEERFTHVGVYSPRTRSPMMIEAARILARALIEVESVRAF